mmetsp:Transcript_9462/g.27647  ORF Transcript_9462/g.27647 Transcript_9462/m.27647 type:complete len:215 (+) Transcript_9462:880-1524(+)
MEGLRVGDLAIREGQGVEDKGERGARTEGGFHAEAAAHGVGQLLANGESDAGSAGNAPRAPARRAGAARVGGHGLEQVEDAAQRKVRDAHARVCHLHVELHRDALPCFVSNCLLEARSAELLPTELPDAHDQRHAPVHGVLDGVGPQIREHLLDALRVAAEHAHAALDVHPEVHVALLLRHRREHVLAAARHRLDHLVQVEVTDAQLELAVLHF